MVSPLPTDQRILDAAQQLMQAHGYHGVSYAAIAAQVGIRKASVFHHFPTKEDLVRAAVARYRGTLRAGLAAIDEPVRSEVRAYFTEHEAWLGEVLAAGRAAGLLRVDEPLTAAAALVIAGIEGALLVARAHADDARFDAVAGHLVSTFRISG